MLSARQGLSPSGWDGDRLIVGYRPALQVKIFGNSVEAQAISRMAQAAGIGGLDKSRHAFGAGSDENTALVFMTHDVQGEVESLVRALASKAFYIWCLGSKRTHAKRCDLLRRAGVDEINITRLCAPIGLFGQARDLTSVAISVLAEILMLRGENIAAGGTS